MIYLTIATRDMISLQKLVFFTVFIGTFCILVSCTQTPDGNAENGAKWFSLYRCSGCHGENGKGGKGPQIADIKLKYSRFMGKIRKSNSNIMPSYVEKDLPDPDIADIYAYLKQQQ